jgi:Asparagine synthase (glutamine-hydrolyzing)
MCGIAGSCQQEKTKKLIEKQSHRGQSKETLEAENFTLGNVLHSVVGHVKQPVQGQGTLTANCEIYNWKELAENHGFDVENDAELLLKLLDKEGKKALKQLDGIYAFAYQKSDKIILGRDKLGVNPIWYVDNENEFAFASEKQALEKSGYEDIRELHPRKILTYNLEEETISFETREFLDIDVNKNTDIDKEAEKIKDLFLDAVKKRIPEGEVGLLLSGGVDSTMVAAALQELGKSFTAYTAGIQYGNVDKPRDVQQAEKVAEKMDIELKVQEVTLEDVEKALPKLSNWLSTTNTVKLGVALPIHFSLDQGGDEKVCFTGFGSEQLYAGYTRQQGYLNKECLSDLRGIFHNDLYRDNVICFRNSRELRIPFLDQDLVEHALTIPEDMKRNEEYKKLVLRKAAEKIGVPKSIAWRKKVAAQYGSNFDKALNKLTEKSGYSHKQGYLNQYREVENKKLVGLTSGGKDSNAALLRMQRRNNKLECLLTLRSKNKDSYMFDSKKEEKDLEWQADRMDIPLRKQNTKGKKEEELKDLERGLEQVKRKFDVDGVVSGAIESTYQRDRVDRVAEKVGLKVYTPLWQFNRKQYMHWLIREGFEVKITDVAARGLDESWIGKVLDEESIEELIDLADKYRFHPAGEGGEYETKVVGFPEELKT